VEKLKPVPGTRVLDVAGGNGQFMRYLGVKEADILDISESGLEAAARAGFRTHLGDIEGRFPFEPKTFDAAYCFEVLEHLHRPNKTLAEVHTVLKDGGSLFVGQPNMRADGTHHVRRYYLGPLLSDLEKSGFVPEWVDYVPAYSMRDAILSDIRKNPSPVRKAVQCVNLSLSFLPWGARYAMAKAVPDRFALLLVVKARKKGTAA
jgi:SAM-dependent methyltransferase